MPEKAIDFAMKTGKLMIMNGAEIYRVEETIERMIAAKHSEPIEVLAISTGIVISTNVDGKPFTLMERTSSKGIDLEIISAANSFARRFTSEDLTEAEAEALFDEAGDPLRFHKAIHLFGSGLAGGFFVPLFGGTMTEFFISYIASCLTVACMDWLTTKDFNFFIKNILGGAALAAICLIIVYFAQYGGITCDYNNVIIGPIMTLVPGVALVNGIRDLVSGELLAGVAKIIEALFIAIGLAFGVGMVIQIMIAVL